MSRRVLGGAAALAVLATTFLGAGAAQAAVERPPISAVERAATLTRPAVVRLAMAYSAVVVDGKGKAFNGGKPFEGGGSCTGFGINPAGYVATAGHCVDLRDLGGIGGMLLDQVVRQAMAADPKLTTDAVLAEARTWTVRGATPGSEPTVQVAVFIGSDGSAPRRYPAQVLGSRPISEGDVALLKIDVTDLPTLPLAADADVAIGEDVLSVGFPGSADQLVDASLEPSNKDGRISSKKTKDGLPFYETSSAMAHGMSGGPTVDMQGRVVGINSWGPAGETAAINFLAPASTLAGFLTERRVAAESGRVDTMFATAFDDYAAGRYTAAVAELDRLLAVAPTHPQAKQLRLAAFEARERYGEIAEPPPGPELPFGLTPVMFWVLVVCAALVVLLLLGALIARMSGRGDAPPGCPRCAAARLPGAAYCTVCGIPQLV
ncbi:trypsin-like peptidase domain-containing protein [Pseudonocardia sp. CA-107938]|uniref:trypsin-like peptidase domain-containing protein n=1 Tax=Pseudonocardia sp. CA-107938 TaxID=3240021 RepID=UPI003D8C053C